MGLGKVWIPFQGVAETANGLVELPLSLECSSQVVECNGIVRLELQRPSKAGHRLFQFSQGQQGRAQIVVRLGIVRLEFHCPSEAAHRLVKFSQLL